MAIQLSGRNSIDLLHRPGQAVQAALAGDVDATWRSLLTPEQLGPAERDALMVKWGIRRDSFQGRVLETVTNPAVILSVLLTYKWPVPTARNMFKVKQGVDGMLARIPVLRSLASPRTVFKDTAVPGILDDLLSAKNEIYGEYMQRRLGPAFAQFEREAGRPVSAREQVIMFNWLRGAHKTAPTGWRGVGVLMPNLDRAMTAPMRRLASTVRETMDDTINKIWKNPEHEAAIRKAAPKLARAGYADEDLEAIASLLGPKGHASIPDFMPLRVVRTEADLKGLRDAIVATAKGQAVSKENQYKMVTLLGRRAYRAEGAVIPSMQELMLVGDLVDKRAYMQLQNAVKDKLMTELGKAGLSSGSMRTLQRRPLDELLSKGRGLVDPGEADLFTAAVAAKMPAQYSMKLEPVLQHYYHTVAGTYGWVIKGHGERMMNEAKVMKALASVDARAKWRSHHLENTIIPSALGKPSARQAINAQLWDQRIGEVFANLNAPGVRKVIGERFADSLQEFYHANQGAFSLRGLAHKAQSYFYLSTLGLNPASAFKNNFQSILTTGPLVGFANAIRGQMDAWSRASKYFDYRFNQKLAHSEALSKAYPEFASAGLANSPITDEALGRAFDAAYRIHKTADLSVSLSERAKRAAMAMFSASETSVRLGAFHAGLRHAATDGLRGAQAIEHARKVVVRTQYLPTLADQPIAFQSGGLLSSPLLRQMASFPARTLEFTVEGIQDGITTGNWARLSRQVAGSYVTMEVGDVLGLNLGDALLGSALPTFTNVSEAGNVLAPLPVVPPAVALSAGVASTLAGDWETIHRQLPLLVPGGVGLARAIGFIPGPGQLPQAAAHWLERKYADYSAANPLTGRIPVYTGQGNLTGYYKPWEIVRHVLGFRGGEIDQEMELAQRITKDGDLMKETRRRYVDALFANDARAAAGIESEYEARFGHKIALTQSQIAQMQERRKLTRIERQLSTLPREARGQYEAEVFGQPLGQAVRTGGYRPVAAANPGYTNQMAPLDELDPYAISRYRGSVPTTPLGQ